MKMQSEMKNGMVGAVLGDIAGLRFALGDFNNVSPIQLCKYREGGFLRNGCLMR